MPTCSLYNRTLKSATQQKLNSSIKARLQITPFTILKLNDHSRSLHVNIRFWLCITIVELWHGTCTLGMQDFISCGRKIFCWLSLAYPYKIHTEKISNAIVFIQASKFTTLLIWLLDTVASVTLVWIMMVRLWIKRTVCSNQKNFPSFIPEFTALIVIGLFIKIRILYIIIWIRKCWLRQMR
jgi:hypothetical protein